MEEQTRAFKGITADSANITKQIKLIAAANLENSGSTAVVAEKINEVREVSRANGAESKTIQRILLQAREPAGRRGGRRKAEALGGSRGRS
jgi:methyl-accepting chemotaxis protein